MSKVVLINTLPRLDYWKVTREPQLGVPLGLLSIGTVLREAGYDVLVVDPIVEEDYLEKIREGVRDALFVGVSVMTSGVASGLQISEFVRENNGSVPILWGGVHPTLLPRQTLDCDLVDLVCWGDGEYTALALADNIRDGHAINDVHGLGLKSNGGIIVNERKEFLDPNKLPLVNYGLVDMDKYLYRDVATLTSLVGKVKVCVLNTGRGCPWSCSFCINTHASQKYRPKSSERVIAEVDGLVEMFDPDVIHIQDDLFFVDKRRVIDFLDHYDRKGYHFKWFTLTRANYFTESYMNDEFMERIKGNCVWLGLGIESGSEAARVRLNKEISVQQISRAVSTLAKHEMVASYAFMVGIPYEDKGELIETAKLVMDIKENHKKGTIACQLYRPYPGTELYKDALGLGYKAPKNLQEWARLQDVETGYTSIKESPWIYQRGLVRYMIEALHWALYKPANLSNGSLSMTVFQFAIIALLQFPMNLSLRFRLWSGWWGCLFEATYCHAIRKMYMLLSRYRG